MVSWRGYEDCDRVEMEQSAQALVDLMVKEREYHRPARLDSFIVQDRGRDPLPLRNVSLRTFRGVVGPPRFLVGERSAKRPTECNEGAGSRQAILQFECNENVKSWSPPTPGAVCHHRSVPPATDAPRSLPSTFRVVPSHCPTFLLIALFILTFILSASVIIVFFTFHHRPVGVGRIAYPHPSVLLSQL